MSSTTASTTEEADTPRTTAEPTSDTTASTAEMVDTPPTAEPTSRVTTSITGTVDGPTAAEPTTGRRDYIAITLFTLLTDENMTSCMFFM